MSDLTIKGQPGQVIVDDPNHAERLLDIKGGTECPKRLTITGGAVGSGEGGGIFAKSATLSVDHCTISGNSAKQSGGGGGIFAQDRRLTIDHTHDLRKLCLLAVGEASTGNSGSTSAGGGGIEAVGGTLSVDHSTISGNRGVQGGGDLHRSRVP